MPLAATLANPAALYRKLQREAYRAFHSNRPTHKADHFFNFCVTAHSMRDYCLEHLGKVNTAEKHPFHDLWNKEPALIAAKEIANSSKHFVLRTPGSVAIKMPATKGVKTGRAKYVDVYQRSDGELLAVPVTRTEVNIELSDGNNLPLYQFTDTILRYWKTYLRGLGIKPRRLPLKGLSDG